MIKRWFPGGDGFFSTLGPMEPWMIFFGTKMDVFDGFGS